MFWLNACKHTAREPGAPRDQKRVLDFIASRFMDGWVKATVWELGTESRLSARGASAPVH